MDELLDLLDALRPVPTVISTATGRITAVITDGRARVYDSGGRHCEHGVSEGLVCGGCAELVGVRGCLALVERSVQS